MLANYNYILPIQDGFEKSFPLVMEMWGHAGWVTHKSSVLDITDTINEVIEKILLTCDSQQTKQNKGVARRIWTSSIARNNQVWRLFSSWQGVPHSLASMKTLVNWLW